MSFDITSVEPAQGAVPPVRVPSPQPARASGVQAGTAESDPVKNDAIPSSPPPEVLDAMSVASAAHDRLAESGRALSFKIDDATGKLVISVHDVHGKVLFTLPPAKALEIASGAPLD